MSATHVYGTLEERFWPKVNKDGPIPDHGAVIRDAPKGV